MLEQILGYFKGAMFESYSASLNLLAPILADLEANYIKDKDAKNALIDTLIQILLAHKDI